MTSTAILIPARYGSTRFPGKPLAMLNGIPMIKRVYETCASSGIPTYVLTDDMRIFELFGPNKCWIDQAEYENGTERCAGAIDTLFFQHYDQFINVQGDMPDVTIDMIKAAEKMLKYYSVTTLITQLKDSVRDDPNSVKLVRAKDKVLWCGRGMQGYGDWHLGVYGYKRYALEEYPNLISTREEQIEGLEQLRWLKNGWDIGVLPVQFDGIEINAYEDTEKWNENIRP